MKNEWIEKAEWAVAYTLDYVLKTLVCSGLLLMPFVPLMFM